MPQPTDPRNYPPEISKILWYVYTKQEPITIPCESASAAITLRFRFGGYIAALRNCGYPEAEQLCTLIARDNSKQIRKGEVPESSACVRIEPRSLTEVTLPESLQQLLADFETEGLTREEPQAAVPEEPEQQEPLSSPNSAPSSSEELDDVLRGLYGDVGGDGGA